MIGGEGDGLVTLKSAHLDDAESEIVVPAEHSNLHRHPRTVLEVRADLDGAPRRFAIVPLSPGAIARRHRDFS